MASTANDWKETFYDAVSHNGAKVYIQAEIPWQADLTWVSAAREFARQNPELQVLLNSSKGELKSKLYFSILQHESVRAYPSLIDKMIEGPRSATIFIYDYIRFREEGLNTLGFSENDVARAPEIKEDIDEFLAVNVLKTSPISNFQVLLTHLNLPNYEPVLKPDRFDPLKIAQNHKNSYRHVVIVAARAQAIFGSLSEIEPDPNLRPAAAIRNLDNLLRIDRAFDKDFEESLSHILAGLYELEVGTDRIYSRRVHVREERSENYDGIQAADVASAVAREIIEKHDKSTRLITEQALIEVKIHFSKTYYNGIVVI